jgi:hypothetical protein
MFHETTLRPLGPSQGKAVVGGPEGEGGGADGWSGGGGGLTTGLITMGGSTAAPGTKNAPGVDDAAGGGDEGNKSEVIKDDAAGNNYEEIGVDAAGALP